MHLALKFAFKFSHMPYHIICHIRPHHTVVRHSKPYNRAFLCSLGHFMTLFTLY